MASSSRVYDRRPHAATLRSKSRSLASVQSSLSAPAVWFDDPPAADAAAPPPRRPGSLVHRALSPSPPVESDAAVVRCGSPEGRSPDGRYIETAFFLLLSQDGRSSAAGPRKVGPRSVGCVTQVAERLVFGRSVYRNGSPGGQSSAAGLRKVGPGRSVVLHGSPDGRMFIRGSPYGLMSDVVPQKVGPRTVGC